MLAKTNNRSETSRRLEEKRNDKMIKFCDHCQQNGRTRDACFKIIGYPEWFKELKEQRKKNGRKGNTANMVIETPIDMTKDKDTYDYASVMNALQERTKIDQKTKLTLVEGKLMDNLYILKHDLNSAWNTTKCLGVVESASSVNPRNDRNDCAQNSESLLSLWHQRLGHAPIDVLKRIDAINVKSELVLPKVCQVCHYSKQHLTEKRADISNSILIPETNNSNESESVLVQECHNEARHENVDQEELLPEARDLIIREDASDEEPLEQDIVHTQHEILPEVDESEDLREESNV
ncbi:uncharacterized protein G2W53_025871 [Senna tora]|uniref:GAG-pre-integrase domain-containing protein n=1 Tax=Senna tora TaxID=362788 RepID=A0A834WIA8_9FABA|nr:uncharacterized protein G2W53_025871 [Senna tora]